MTASLAPTQAPPFRALYEEHQGFVRRSLTGLGVRGADLDDVCHEVFLVLHARLDVYRAMDGATPWLYEVCRRTASAHRRRAFRRTEITTDDPEVWARAEVGVPPSGDDEGAIVAALQRLDPARREVLLYGDLAEVSVSDLAVLLDCDRKTARKRLLLARHRMAKLLNSSAAPMAATDRPEDEPRTALFEAARIRGYPGDEDDEPTPFRVVVSTPHFAAAVCGRAFMTVWRRASREEIDLLASSASDVYHARGGRFAYLTVVESTCPPPAFSSRARLVEITRDARSHLSSYATVLTGGPSAFVVPVMNVIFYLVGVPFPARFVRSTAAAAAWSVKRSGLSMDAAVLAQHLNTLREVSTANS